MTPPLVCVTGLDAVGKSTLLAVVRRSLARAGVRGVATVSVWTALPAGAPRAAALDRHLGRLDPLARALLLAHACRTALVAACREGAALCLLDGWWFKYAALEATMGAPPPALRALGRLLPAPALTFHLVLEARRAALRRAGQDSGTRERGRPPGAAARMRGRAEPPRITGYETGFAPVPTRAAFVRFQRRAATHLRRLLAAHQPIALDARRPPGALAGAVLARLAPLVARAGRTRESRPAD